MEETTGTRVFPSKTDSGDRQLGWRIDWSGQRWVDGVWQTTLDLQPNRNAKLRQLRERARGLHTSLGLLIIRSDDREKLPKNFDVTALFGTIVDEDDMQKTKEQRKEKRRLEKKQERKVNQGKKK